MLKVIFAAFYIFQQSFLKRKIGPRGIVNKIYLCLFHVSRYLIRI